MCASPSPRTQLIVAVIGALAIVIAAILGNEKFAERIIDVLQTNMITIYPSTTSSGSAAHYSGNNLLTFAESSNILAAGDTETDQLVKSFLSFYLGDIPQNAKIIEASMRIPYYVSGQPEALGQLILKEYKFGQYTQAAFNGVPLSNWWVSWNNWNKVDARRGSLTVLSNELREVVQRNLSGKWLQFVFSFEANLIIPNQSIDGIGLDELPTLTVNYQEQP